MPDFRYICPSFCVTWPWTWCGPCG